MNTSGYTLPRLADPVSFVTFVRACNTLDLAPEMALRDPVLTLRLVASCPVETHQAFIDLTCLPDARPDLLSMRPDVSALLAAMLWIELVEKVRRQRKATSGRS